MNSDIESLMSQYLDGRMNAAEAAELSRLLIENPEAAARFAELTRTDEGLRTALKAETRSAIFAARLRTQAEKQPAKTTAPDRRRWLAAAAGLAVLGGTAWWFSHDNTAPAMLMDWAKTRVKRNSGGNPNGDDSGNPASAGLRASLPVDRAAELRRKLRNFAIPYLHMRSMPVSDALNTLSLQWTSLPHVKAGDADKVKIALADSVRKRWLTIDKEPVVSVDIPNLSLHTALNLIAAQAGLKVEVADEAVTLISDPTFPLATAQTVADAHSRGTIGEDDVTAVTAKPEDLKTWTFPLAKPVAETFLASLNQRQQPAAANPANLANVITLAGQSERLNAAPAANLYGFSYSAAAKPPVTISGIAAGREAASSSNTTDKVELSFTVADVSAYEANPNQEATVRVISEAESAAVEGNVIGAPDQPAAEAAVEDQIVIGTTFQTSTDLPSLATTDGATPAALPPQALYLAENNSVQQSTIIGVRSVTTEAIAGVRLQATSDAVPAPDADPRLTLTSKELSYDWLTRNPATTDPASEVQLGKPVTITTRFVQSDPLISGVTWFVKPPPPTLDSWLTGLSGGGTVSHDTDNNVLSVTGTPAELRTAAAAVAALNESVQWGVSVDARYIELGDLPAPEIRTDSGPPTIASAEVEKLCKAAANNPGSACVRLPALSSALEKAALLKIEKGRSFINAPTNSAPAGSSGAEAAADGTSTSSEATSYARNAFGDASRYPNLFLDATVTAAKQGERWTLTTTMKDGSSELNNKASFMDGSWLVLEGTKGRYLLLRPRSANIGS